MCHSAAQILRLQLFAPGSESLLLEITARVRSQSTKGMASYAHHAEHATEKQRLRAHLDSNICFDQRGVLTQTV
jgi:hypothetical protein